MKSTLLWNRYQKRLRAGWRILFQVLLTSSPLAILSLSGFYDQGNQVLKVSFTAGPITMLSVFISSRYIDKRKFSDLGIWTAKKSWWREYGFGILAGFLSASSLVLLLKILGLCQVIGSNQWRARFWSFIGSFLVALLAYLIVGFFEEMMRVYQIINTVEGLSGTKYCLNGAGFLAVLVGASWSIVGHLISWDFSFLAYILVTAIIYGLFFIWTGRAALAMAMHFAWDFTISNIFQLGSTSELSLFYVHLSGIPDHPLDLITLLGMAAKCFGLLLVVWWIYKKERIIQIKPGLGTPYLINDEEASLYTQI